MPLVQLVIDNSTNKVISGYYEFDRDNGGTLIVPSGSSLPGSPSAKELFWNTTDGILYRRNDGNTAWDAISAEAGAHALGGSSHTADTLANLNSKVSDATLDDSSDPRDPNAHASTHQSGGSDSVKLDDLGSPDDNTDLNSTTDAHGLLPKLGGGTTNFLRADGTWATPSGGMVAHDLGGSYHNADTLANLNSKVSDATLDDSSDPRDPNAHNTTHQSAGSDAIKLDDLASPDDNTDLNSTTGAHGLLPKLGGGTTNYLRADGTWATPPGGSSGLPIDYITGLGIARNTTYPNYKIDITAGKCRSDDDTTDIVASSTITVDITSSGANGLDTGSEASSTWYFIWLIYNPTSETTAGLLSTSSSSPTMPSGYTKKRRIGSSFNNGSSNFRKWVQRISGGQIREYDYYQEEETTCLVMYNGTSDTWADVDVSDFVPPTSTIVLCATTLYGAVVTDCVYFRAKGETEDTPALALYSGDTGLGSTMDEIYAYLRTDSSQILQYKCYGTSSIACSFSASGYTEII